MSLRVVLNGAVQELAELAAGASLHEVLQGLGLKKDRVAAELNGVIAPRSSWDALLVQQDDKVEVVHFVGGGCA